MQGTFAPLNRPARSAQPQPGEWCVDLQQRCWFLGLAPINLGDYLELFVLHDALHIDQAQRALAAYRQRAAS